MSTPQILVVGSLNMDWVARTQRFPQPGESVLATAFSSFPGGKGANQAVAAARLGAQVALIGAVGDDAPGRTLLQQLRHEGVDGDAVVRLPDTPTGLANITVAGSDNCIVVVGGANQALTPAHIRQQANRFAAADVVLAQLEIPLSCVSAAAALARHYHKPFILNPAPAIRLPEHLLRHTTLLTPNQYELCTSLGLPVLPAPTHEPPARPATLHTPVLVTLGAAGACFFDPQQPIGQPQPGFAVRAQDSTGAGDTFNGALAAFWQLGLPEATRRACAAAALACTRVGAQSAMPTTTELMAFLAQQVAS